MALNGLYKTPHIEIPEKGLAFMRTTELDVTEPVEVTLEALKLLGIIEHNDQAKQSITADFTALSELDYDGRLHVLPGIGVSFDHILQTAEAIKPENVPVLYRFTNLWTPNTESNSYSQAELNGGPENHVARLAVYNADTNTSVDPVLHYLNTPYDEKYQENCSTTQLQELEQDQQDFNVKYEDFKLSSLDHKAFAMLALMDRIRGGVAPNSKDFILNTGFMRIPDLGRRDVCGDSCVGNVDSDDGQLKFDCSYGVAGVFNGVGLSVGIK
jgi:hypothetical protein